MSLGEKYIPDIYEIDDIDKCIAEYPPYYERSFTKRYCVEFNKENLNLDTCISMYSSKLCMIFLAEGHSIIQEGKSIKQFDFKVGKEDRLANSTGGKYKKKAQRLQRDSVICFIETTDGNKYPVKAGIKGRLIDINPAVVKNPSISIEKHKSTGYIALIHPENFRSPPEEVLSGLLTKNDYENVLSSCQNYKTE
ncbi:protein Abitram-like [Coccinella septempunctata]|uniref:protein Abitram-like n=1 Tax=Coccinella septempunctata TaxID=41139 RepID=UPI001D0747A9|nr:protein Abitram-like [Coccinella septempunctata]